MNKLKAYIFIALLFSPVSMLFLTGCDSKEKQTSKKVTVITPCKTYYDAELGYVGSSNAKIIFNGKVIYLSGNYIIERQ